MNGLVSISPSAADIFARYLLLGCETRLELRAADESVDKASKSLFQFLRQGGVMMG